MADTSERLRLHAPTGGDPADVPADIKRLRDQLDEVVLGYSQGRLAARPAPRAGGGRMYYAVDDGQLYYDTGTAWVPAAWQPGDIRWTAIATGVTAGWESCQGQELSRTRYRALFDAIGDFHGRGDGSTTFNAPDLVGRVPVGQDPFARRLRDPIYMGTARGEERHTLTVAEMPQHTHSVTRGQANISGGYIGVASITYGGSAQPGYTGEDAPHNNMQPYLGLNAWIKV